MLRHDPEKSQLLNRQGAGVGLYPYVWLAMAFVLLMGLLGAAYWGSLLSHRGFESVIHQQEAFGHVLRLFTDLKEAEDWQREYLLTGEGRYLAPYQVAVAKIGEQLRAMRSAIGPESPVYERLDRLEELTGQRLALLQKAVLLRERKGIEAALEVVRTGQGATVAAEIRRVLLEVEIEDMGLSKQQHDRAHMIAGLTILTMGTGMALFVLTAIAIVWRIRRDLETRQRLERRLLEEARLAEIARVLGDIGHDVKNMLMPIISGAELLHQDLTEHFARLPEVEAAKAGASQELSKEVLNMTRTGSRRIQDRVREIADAVKGQTTLPKFDPCTVEKVVKSVFETLGLYANERKVSLRSEGLSSLPSIVGDERLLFNAFYNLINNAIAEVPAGGSVTVQGLEDATAKTVVLSVADTGRGMPPEIRDSLFTYQAISRKAGGTGLGTKIVKDVVDAHGGTISVDSQQGVGTVFRLRLPIHGPTQAVSASGP